MTKFALIRVDVNSNERGEIISNHRTLRGAGRAYLALNNQRGAYVAVVDTDGNYPSLVDARDAGTTADALEAAR